MTDLPTTEPTDDLMPIREVSRLTGVNAVTLRAWERRYGLIRPIRTESGHRLYSAQDVETVRQIQTWIQRGIAVSKVGDLLARQEPLPSTPAQPRYASWHLRLQQALVHFDALSLKQTLDDLRQQFPDHRALADTLLPVWEALRLSQDRVGGRSEWLFLDLQARAWAWQQWAERPDQAQGPRLLIGTPPGHCQELELLILTLQLAVSLPGMQLQLLAADQPLNELGLHGEHLQPAAILLLSHQQPGPELIRQLKRLAQSLDCPLALSGRISGLGAAALQDTGIACLAAQEPDHLVRQLRLLLDGRLET